MNSDGAVEPCARRAYSNNVTRPTSVPTACNSQGIVSDFRIRRFVVEAGIGQPDKVCHRITKHDELLAGVHSNMKTAFVSTRLSCVMLLTVGAAHAAAAVHSGVQPSLPTDEALARADVLKNARNEVELLAAQLEVGKANAEEGKVNVKLAEEYLLQLSMPNADGAVSQSRIESARANVDSLKAQLKVKQAEQHVAEVRLKQAQGRLTRLQSGGPRPNALRHRSAQQQALLESRVHAAHRAYDSSLNAWQKATGPTQDEQQVYHWSRRWLEAQCELAEKHTEKAAAINAHLDRMKKLENQAKVLHESGKAPASAVPAAEYYRLEAESWLMQATE